MVRELGPELAARLDPVYPADNPVVDQSPFSGEGLPLKGDWSTTGLSAG